MRLNFFLITLLLLFSQVAYSNSEDIEVTLFTNVNVFDGINEKLINNAYGA